VSRRVIFTMRTRRRQIKAAMLEALAETLHNDAHHLGAGYLYGEDGEEGLGVDPDHDVIKSVADELEAELRDRALRLEKGQMAVEASRGLRR
jgi:hypothetical protein